MAEEKKEPLYISEEIEYFAVTLLPLMGYIILGLILIDYIALLVQPQFFNPNWEYQTMGKIVETIWAPIIGFALIFYRREGNTIDPKELRLLSWISRFALLLGILYLFMVPLLVVNTVRIHELNRAGLIVQFDNNENQLEGVQEQLDRASEEQIRRRFPNKNREEVLAQFQDEVKNFKEQALDNYEAQVGDLITLTVKWCLGAILGATSLILIWRYTFWARQLGGRER